MKGVLKDISQCLHCIVGAVSLRGRPQSKGPGRALLCGSSGSWGSRVSGSWRSWRAPAAEQTRTALCSCWLPGRTVWPARCKAASRRRTAQPAAARFAPRVASPGRVSSPADKNNGQVRGQPRPGCWQAGNVVMIVERSVVLHTACSTLTVSPFEAEARLNAI
jgi:hypothetical protein